MSDLTSQLPSPSGDEEKAATSPARFRKGTGRGGRLLALDLDGTLLTSRHELTDRTRRAVAAASESGLHVILVSARPPRSVAGIAARIGLHDPYVALNGGIVVDETGALLVSTVMRRADLGEVLYGSRAHGLVANLFSGFHWHADRLDDLVRAETQIVGFSPVLGEVSDDVLDRVGKVLVMGQAESVRTLYEELSGRGLHLQITFSKPEYLEISPAGITKAVGLALVCEHLKIRPDEVIAVGDNFNDLEMLEFAGMSVVVYNAPDEVRRRADRVIPANDEDGVAQFVEELTRAHHKGTLATEAKT